MMRKSSLLSTRIYNISKFVALAWFLCIPTTILSVLVHQIYRPEEYSPIYERFVISWLPPSLISPSASQFDMISSIISTATYNFLSSWQQVVVISIVLQFVFFDGRGILLAHLPLPKWARGEPVLDLDDSDLPPLEPDPRLTKDGDLDLTRAQFQYVRRGDSQKRGMSSFLSRSQDSSTPTSRCASPHPVARDEFVFHPVYGTIPREVRDLWEMQARQARETEPRRRKLPPVRGSSGNSAQNSPVTARKTTDT